MATKDKNILWEVGCEGHTDAWVIADNWEQATVKAAEFWGVSWRSVAALCELKNKKVGCKNNVCYKCGRVYYGALPLCDICKKTAVLEEQEARRRLNKAYRMGKVV